MHNFIYFLEYLTKIEYKRILCRSRKIKSYATKIKPYDIIPKKIVSFMAHFYITASLSS